MQKQLAPYREQLDAQLTRIGHPASHIANYPELEATLFSGRVTPPVRVQLTPDIQLEGRLHIVMTEGGPEIRITPLLPYLSIPNEVGGVVLSAAEKRQLEQEGALPRPLLIPANGEYVPTYLRVDEQTNTVELWRVRPELLPTRLMGVDLTRDQQLQLANGSPVRLSGLLDQQGEPFTATVSIAAARQELQFRDISRLAPQVRPDTEQTQQLALNNEGAKTDQLRHVETKTGQAIHSHQQQEPLQRSAVEKPALRDSVPKQRLT